MLKKESFKVAGLDCQEEIALLKKALASREGVLQLSFDVMQARMEVEYEEKKITSDEIIASVQASGLRASLWIHRRSLEKLTWWGQNGRLFMTVLCGIFIILGLITGEVVFKRVMHLFSKEELKSGTFLPYVSVMFYTFAIICGLWHVAGKAFFSVKKLRADMNLLMMVASIGAMIIGQWFEGASVVFLFSVSLLLEQASVKRARNAVATLMDLTPDVAHLVSDKGTVDVKLADLKVGDTVLVKASEKIPIDAVITKGSSAINQAPITGESMPVEKKENDEVFAGTINEESSLECKVTKLSFDTTLAKMIYMIEHAQSKRAKSEKTIEKFAALYTPVMIALAIIIGIGPPLIFDAKWIEWVYRGLVVLVIACPCALVISTPVCLISGLTSAARQGVLIKGGIFLEIAKDLKAIAFDKTGTLTYGKPSIQKMVPLNGTKEDELLKIAASLEKGSTHPLGKAIVEKAAERNIEADVASSVKLIQGKGIEGIVGDQAYWMGSHRFMHEKGQETEEIHKTAEELEDAGHTVIAIGNAEKIIGLVSIADEPREGMAALMDEIRVSGIKKTIMLTGDNTKCAKEIAQKTKVDEFFSELLPEDKLKAIGSLKAKYGLCAMIGDGVNDAPAMATADLGIAMGAIGTDAAIETADIALMQDDLSKVPWLIRHSKRTMKILYQNIIFALAVKVIFLALAIVGIAGLWMAIAADTGASLLVVFNALRLLHKEKAK
ncbi:MAG: Cadmium-transporting ATPase [Chlamydiia bacterium]|nr:Cadmium-transporting ATPase [Chlamydiia bacterium]